MKIHRSTVLENEDKSTPALIWSSAVQDID